MKIIATDEDSAAQDMVKYITENMEPDEIQDWLEVAKVMILAHMNTCGDNIESLTDYDESFLFVGNALLYTLGLNEMYLTSNSEMKH